jgi:hypothetical protein
MHQRAPFPRILADEWAHPTPPLTGYSLPDEAYTDDPLHIACMLPAIRISPDWTSPERRTGMLPVGTRWQCGDCGLIHVVVLTSRGREWEIERIPGVPVGG